VDEQDEKAAEGDDERDDTEGDEEEGVEEEEGCDEEEIDEEEIDEEEIDEEESGEEESVEEEEEEEEECDEEEIDEEESDEEESDEEESDEDDDPSSCSECSYGNARVQQLIDEGRELYEPPSMDSESSDAPIANKRPRHMESKGSGSSDDSGDDSKKKRIKPNAKESGLSTHPVERYAMFTNQLWSGFVNLWGPLNGSMSLQYMDIHRRVVENNYSAETKSECAQTFKERSFAFQNAFEKYLLGTDPKQHGDAWLNWKESRDTVLKYLRSG